MTRKLLVKRLFLFALLVAALALPVSARRTVAQCSPPECSPPEPPYEPPPSGGGGGGSWSGYHDGRLNPSMDEYYSIWCRNDLIEVWGGQPTPQLIGNIPMVDVLALGDIGSLDAGHGLSLSRSGDIVVISGSNGNGGGSGSKSFSLSECIARNGGVPESPPPPQPPPPQPSQPTATPTPDPADEAVSNVALCLPGTTSMADFLRCLNFFGPDTPSSTYVYIVSWAIATFCAGGFAPIGLVAAVPAFRLWRRRRGR